MRSACTELETLSMSARIRHHRATQVVIEEGKLSHYIQFELKFGLPYISTIYGTQTQPLQLFFSILLFVIHLSRIMSEKLWLQRLCPEILQVFCTFVPIFCRAAILIPKELRRSRSNTSQNKSQLTLSQNSDYKIVQVTFSSLRVPE